MNRCLTPLPGLEDDAIRRLVAPAPSADQSIQERFEAFHDLNPWVFRALERMTADCADKGFKQLGIGMLFEVLRWRYGQATEGDPFRLNNNFRSRYVRLLIEQHPEWSRLFELRALRSS
ncbi:hypothetical protein JIX56_19695 [Streptomyces sp. CA-210063]|uniref:hypothetical protein n=1 Tax=Streptomyces sp. CA-210063 TaxID=2801029 RepID=UPI00214C95E6|nr:hypothetical protein [Streptomyces sp. CA-210063]UUU31946.1 hypothetical protein JIX56_19695 [Streptomyces sp. CA-210063]